MPRPTTRPLAAAALTAALIAASAEAPAASRSARRAVTAARVTGARVEIRGEVVDLDCYLRDGSRGAAHRSCATACVAHCGSLAILEDDTARLYPLAGDKVASDPNKPVRELVARHVLVRGRLWERNR
ncbi:MAG: hypothetical protein ACKOCT_02155, partial [Alphaproteobacteria bacterium]